MLRMNSCRAGGLLFSVLVLFGGVILFGAETPSPEPPEVRLEKLAGLPTVPREIAEAIQDHRYDEAVRLIDEELTRKPAQSDYLVYLKGRALYLQQQYDAAVEVFRQAEKEFPKSSWRYWFRFGQALALARKGDFAGAEAIYRDEAQRILSPERSEELAAVYIEFADRYFQPANPMEEKPDYNKAREFYTRALEVNPSPSVRARIAFQIARCHHLAPAWLQAATAYREFLQQFPGDPREVQARLYLGEVLLAMGNTVEARRVWEDLLSKFGDQPGEEVATAAFRLAETRGMPSPATDEDLSQGVNYLRQFLERFPKDRRVPAAYLQMAQGYAHLQHWDEAEKVLSEFLADPRAEKSPERAEAIFLLGSVYLNEQRFAKAIETWRTFIEQFPTHPRWSEVQTLIIDAEYQEAVSLHEAEKYSEAEGAFRKFLASHPLDSRAPEILFTLGTIAFQQKNYEEAIRRWQQLADKYPDNTWGQKAIYTIAQVYEEKLLDAEKALEYYRKVTGPLASVAQSAIAKLTARTLWAETVRVYRSDEIPKIRLVTRNIEKVTIAIYRIDPEAYFRKYRTLQGVEHLDLALIDPDEKREFTIPDYKPYVELETFIPLPLPGDQKAGVAAVTISSQTLEVTTLLLQSDLDLVVKSSREELFVFAENMRETKPWAGVRLLVAAGDGQLQEVRTNEEGIYLGKLPGNSSEEVSVLAIADGHVTSNEWSLEGVSTARGLTDRGLIYTDRPIYRPGQVVNVRGIIRLASSQKAETPQEAPGATAENQSESPQGSADRLIAPVGRKFHLQVLDSANRPLRAIDVTLDSYGCLHDQFFLPEAAPLGQYRVVADDGEGHVFQGGFQVTSFEVDPVQITIDTPRQVYYRGEKIEGTIRVAFSFGTPLGREEVRYQLAGEPVQTAITDENGEVRFSFDTRDYSEAQVLPFQVVLPRRNLTSGVNFVLAIQGFSIHLSTPREVYLPGESFEVRVETKDAAGKPCAEKLVLKAMRRTRAGRIQGSVTVSETPVETDSDGTGRIVLRLEEGGEYILRAEGTDRFGHPIWGEIAVKVSDDKDSDRLHIFADRHTFRVGDTARVRIHWKEQPTLAVVCFQGAHILGHRLVSLKTGDNELDIPISGEMAPRFDLSVAVMRDVRDERALVGRPSADSGDTVAELTPPPRRFFEAVSGFDVQRDLRVKVEWKIKGQPAKKTPSPGDELEVTLITTDAQGQPIPAQVSVALVESLLLERFGRGPSLVEWFRGETREGAFRTLSTIEFRYQPITRPINRLLLAEEEREQLEADEAATRLALGTLGGMGGGFAESNRDAAAMAAQPGIPAMEALRKRKQEQLAEAEQEKKANALARSGRPTDGKSAEAKQIFEGGMTELPAVNAAGERQLKLAMDKYFARAEEEKASAAGRFLLPTQANLQQVSTMSAREFLVLDAQGRLQFLGPGQLEKADLAALAEQLNKQGSLLYPLSSAAETAFWDPAVETGPDGKATLTIPIPDRATTWRLIAQGVTVDTLVGEDDITVQAGKDFFAEIKWPEVLRLGDTAEIPVVLHNGRFDSGTVEVQLTRVVGTRRSTDTQRVTLQKKGPASVTFSVATELPGEWNDALQGAENPKQMEDLLRQNVEFHLAVLDADSREVLESVTHTVPLRPQGVMEYQTSGGSAIGDTTTWLELPDVAGSSPWLLEIVVGPSIERSLLDLVTGSPQKVKLPLVETSTPAERLVADLMTAVVVQDYLRKVAPQEVSMIPVIDARIRTAIAGLVASQQEDGGWAWIGCVLPEERAKRKVASDPRMSALAFWALCLARSAGYGIAQPAMDRATAFLNQAIASAPAEDNEIRAVLVHALAQMKQADFALLNRLHRERQNLSLEGKLYLTLTLAAMDRKPMAEEVLQLIDPTVLAEPKPEERIVFGALSPAEAHALYALALEAVLPQSPELPRQIDWLLAHRVGNRWIPDRATGPAAFALTQWFGNQGFQNESCQITVFVNDFQVASLSLDPLSATQSLLVPPKFLVKGKQRIQFRVEGRARYTYQCIASHFVATTVARETPYRYMLRAAPLEVEGREILAGTGVVIPQPGWSMPVNPVTQLPVGKQAIVSVDVFPGWDQKSNQITQLIVSVPIPGGAAVVPQSIQTTSERYEIRPGEVVFYVSRRDPAAGVSFSFRIVGLVPGKYDLDAVVVRDANDPAGYGVIRPSRSSEENLKLEVLPPGSPSKDQYVLSPQEMYELGKIAFNKQNWQEAEKYLSQLLRSTNWRVRDEVLKELAPMMVDIYLQLDKPHEVVQYFEILKVKWPDFEIPFEKILKIAACYERMGEYERSFLIFRATVENRFVADSNVAGFLDEQKEFLRSVEVMNRLLAEYPPEPYTAAARYALAQRIYAKAGEDDPRLRKARINRIHLVHLAWEMLDRFLTAFPEDPAADQAAFAAANALLEGQFYGQAAASAARYAERYPKSPLVDSFWYMIGYCQYAMGQYQQAIDMCKKVAETQRTDPTTGRTVESPNKWQALYILGQIYHSLGQPGQAIQYYGMVAQRFSDAKEAIEYFTRKAIQIPEVTTIPPGKPVTIPLHFRNLATCEVRAYRVDLFKFALLKRDLAGIAEINLAGIRPEHEETLTLGDGRDYRDRERDLKLPFQKEGAYLVVCRGESLYTSGMVVVSPLTLEVQEDPASGRVRVTIKDRSDKFIKGVQVKVIGSRNGDFVSGETDLRGVFVADGIRGKVTVIARYEDDKYAFYRGKVELLPEAPPAAQAPQAAAPAPGQAAKPGEPPRRRAEDELLRGLRESNQLFQQQQLENLQRMYRQKRKGVEASQAF
ncbi:tetratricopeptide repeat protein [Thermogutta sp.]|uniref:tetratricopeptide repeat protein n=1 Tax=Thermogutta sp. TaxID=1962930 RepID=UPI003C7DCB59